MKSVQNLSLIKRTTLHPGLLIPIYSRKCLAGDRFTIDLRTLLQSQPLVSQLLGTFKLQASVFFDSDANYYGWMDNNTRLTTPDLLQKVRHQVDPSSLLSGAWTPSATYSAWLSRSANNQVCNGSIWDYAGLPAGFVNRPDLGGNPICDDFSLDAGFVLTYLNIFRNYYANNQENTFPFLTGLSVDPPETPFMYSELSILDDLFRELRYQKDGYVFEVGIQDPEFPGIDWFQNTYLSNTLRESAGLLTGTYLPDMLVNLLNSESNNAQSTVTVTDGKFNIDTLRFQNKLQRLIDRYDVSGGRFSNWLRTVWGVETRRDMDIPELIGVSQTIIDPSTVVAQSAGTTSDPNTSTPLGDFGGNFKNYDNHRSHSFVASTPGRVMVIVNLVPMVDYCQGIEPELTEAAFADEYSPEFAQLGFQKVPKSTYSVMPNFSAGKLVAENSPFSTSVGKQVAWLPLMTAVNRCHGEFAECGRFNSWVLRRRYQRLIDASQDTQQTATRITQYIDPLEYQYPFVAQAITDPNWFFQMAIDVKAIRPIGKRFMPNLE